MLKPKVLSRRWCWRSATNDWLEQKMVKTARKACQDTHIDSLWNTAATGLKANMADERQFLGKLDKNKEADKVVEGWCKFQKFVKGNETARIWWTYGTKYSRAAPRTQNENKNIKKTGIHFLLSHATGQSGTQRKSKSRNQTNSRNWSHRRWLLFSIELYCYKPLATKTHRK